MSVSQPPKPAVVVVGVDGSDESKAALRWAAAQAEATGSALRAIMGWHSPLGFYGYNVPKQIQDDARADCQKMLDDAVAEVVKAHPGIQATAEVVDATATQALLDAASAAQLLVVGSQGRGKFSGMLLGSVSQHCVSHATCPVVIVRSDVA
jgi:nucleotide-binding universal stress UspA family protein